MELSYNCIDLATTRRSRKWKALARSGVRWRMLADLWLIVYPITAATPMPSRGRPSRAHAYIAAEQIARNCSVQTIVTQ